MIPRQDIKCLYKGQTFDEALEFVKNNNHTRFPLCDKDKDHILGMIHIRDMLEFNPQSGEQYVLKKLARKVLFVPENKSISDILHEMMAKRIHMAVVVDEYGGTAGLLSMEDILEELVGEIQDEHDEEEVPMKKLKDGVFEFDGTYLIEDAYTDMSLPMPEYEESTIGGYVFGLLGRVPNVGDKAEDFYCTYEVLGVNNMRITRVKVSVRYSISDEEE